ncbi:MAG: class II fructose-bisphosphatase [Planctomycetota bacterium]|jgi:fructose-1,6-bisphosphatase class II
MRHDLAAHFLRIAEDAAVAAARMIGYGDKHHADHVAVEAMRSAMDHAPMRGKIVIGEGERDEAPMLYIGEEVGERKPDHPEIDIAVDPLEGTNLCATGAPNSIAVIAGAPGGGLLHAPDVYLDKIVVGPRAKGVLHLEATMKENLTELARCLKRSISDLLIVILERKRHEQLIADVREAGARIRLVTDGDLAPGVAASLDGSGVHAVMGAGGAPEGVLTAAAMRCLGGQIQGRLVPARDGDVERLAKAGYPDLSKIYQTEDLAPADDILFCASGVTTGALLKGVRFFGGGQRVHSLVMTSRAPRSMRFIDNIRVKDAYAGPIQSGQ